MAIDRLDRLPPLLPLFPSLPQPLDESHIPSRLRRILRRRNRPDVGR